MNTIEGQCRHWVDTMVVGLNLCPFAKRSLDEDSVRFCIHEGKLAELADSFIAELQRLDVDPSIETTLLVIANGLEDFDHYLDVLDGANAILEELDYVGEYQIASFHPDYQFENTHPNDVENYTNRSPYPILHILREASLEKAIAAFGEENAEQVPENNIRTLQSLGLQHIKVLLSRSHNP